jgi:hypothetical protein
LKSELSSRFSAQTAAPLKEEKDGNHWNKPAGDSSAAPLCGLSKGALMSTSQEGVLEAILLELKEISHEVRALRKELRETELPLSSQIAEPDNSVDADKAADRTAKEEEAFLSVFDWLASRNITVKNYRQQEATDEIFDRMATFLGERFDSLVNLHDQIRRNLSTGSSFTLNLASGSQEEIANSTQLCTWLHRYAFLSSYKYNSYSKTIYAAPQRVGRVINFFTGGWFERFVFLKVSSLLSQNDLEYVHLANPQISLPNGDDFELDLLFLVGDEPLWLECKTGDYQSHVAKYANVRPTLGISEERSILVILGTPDDLASQLTDLYDITVANENTLLPQVAAALDLVEIPRDTTPTHPVQPGKLATLLNKAGLRPLPEIRAKAIDQLIDLAGSKDESENLAEIKPLLAERLQISKSKTQDIMNAIVKSGCLVDEEGEPVYSFTTPFDELISSDPDDIEQRVMESYIQAVLMIDRTCFNDGSKIAEFEQITGGKIPNTEKIEKIKAKVQNLVDDTA